MRRTKIRRGAVAFLVATTITATVGVAFATRAASAEEEAPAMAPSCSLHPTRLPDGTVTLTNDSTAPRFLQVAEDGMIVWNADLAVGESTPPLHLTGAAVIGWGTPYPLAAYDMVGWCAEDAVTTTTVAPPPSTTSPPTTSTPTTAPTATTAPPPSTTIALPSTPTEPAPSCLTDRCETLTVASTASGADDVAVEGTQQTRTAPLPVTGGGPSPAEALLVLLLLGFGALLVAATRAELRRR